MEYKHKLFTLAIAFIALRMAMAGDPDIIFDFIVPPNTTIVDGNIFTFTGMRVSRRCTIPNNFQGSKSKHGRVSSFERPKRLFCSSPYNSDAKNPAAAVSAFGSASAGTVSVPSTVFNTSIDDGILAKSFKTDVATIQKIKAGLSPRA
ncbi:hypothetical protein Acr_27g0005310 [Actinidia rufa]|uniref:Uncharacterized protein n=1 Tax=Actinidia rufa TaxID=165716 RepID=A0A7J0H6S6_9ERIC|nr:hypothetical protein Acr_27g0005310 [Actinidia rufa]